MAGVMNDLGLTCADLQAILQGVALDLEGHLEELRELDAALGDGDLGVTVQLACGAMAGASQTGQEDDVGLMLATLGMSINKVSPSTFGTLLAAAFLGAGAVVRGKSSVGVEDLAAMGAGAVGGLKKRGKADVGDKTMLDALAPAVEAFTREVDRHAGAAQAFEATVRASETGMQATAGMVAKYGRASWRREESLGLRDAGATALHYMIQSFCHRAAGYFVSSGE
jgi:dihydroxyacetone kinase-like protein